MGKTHRLLGYLASFAAASVFYMLWIAAQSRSPGSDRISLFDIGFAFFLWLFGGTGAALLLSALPLYLAAIWRNRLQRFGPLYFGFIGAAALFILGCIAAALAPKPLFVEDQTFREGFLIAVQRQGICLLLTGLVFGLTFWVVSDRRRHSGPTESS